MAGNGHAAWQHQLSDRGLHHLHPRLLCRDGVWAGRAFLAEYFPGRIRYTSVSVPYHIGNGWGGGLVPFITSAAFAATGSIGYALIYPIAIPAICFVLALFLMPETRKISIWEPIEPENRIVTKPTVWGTGYLKGEAFADCAEGVAFDNAD